MLPLRNEDFIKYLRQNVYSPGKVLDLLGPTLTRKIILTAPFFRWVPPEGEPTMLMALPSSLEEIDDEYLRDIALQEYVGYG